MVNTTENPDEPQACAHQWNWLPAGKDVEHRYLQIRECTVCGMRHTIDNSDKARGLVQ